MIARQRRPAAAAEAAYARTLGSPGPAELSAMTSGLPLTLRRPWRRGLLDQAARVRQHGGQEAVRLRRRTGWRHCTAGSNPARADLPQSVRRGDLVPATPDTEAGADTSFPPL